jgi:murein DD-endopeptidase MepM/ murein hydrolase activator NlpD
MLPNSDLKSIQINLLTFILLLSLSSCKNESYLTRDIAPEKPYNLTNGFDFPVGKPDGKGYYNAQKFGKNNHLGDDWNGLGGGNSDLGDPIYAIANGYVSLAEDIKGGWGNVIRIVHFLNENEQIESLYAHCNKINVKLGDYVKKGELIGTIGNNRGLYLAHLHLELRSSPDLPIGGGYANSKAGYLDPTNFIKCHRE